MKADRVTEKQNGSQGYGQRKMGSQTNRRRNLETGKLPERQTQSHTHRMTDRDTATNRGMRQNDRQGNRQVYR